jgi:hypothetical protein
VKREPKDDGPDETRGKGSAVLEVEQVFAHADPDRPPTSAIRLRYVDAKGLNAKVYLAREPIVGQLDHEASGRPRTRTLQVRGGSASERTECLDLLGGLLFAGFAGSPPWLPPRPVQPGEAWQLEAFTNLRAVDSVLRQARKIGMEVPRPSFSGTARLEAVTEKDGETLLEVSLDALLEVQGAFRKDGVAGHLSFGDRVHGRAVISARTGLPVSFRVTHTGTRKVEAPGHPAEQEFTSEVDGRVERLKRR